MNEDKYEIGGKPLTEQHLKGCGYNQEIEYRHPPKELNQKDLEPFDVNVSWFEHSKSIVPRTVSLKDWILKTINSQSVSGKTRSLLNALRDDQEPLSISEQGKLKEMLPMLTPSALLKTRSKTVNKADKIISLSGFMQFDVDYKDNTDKTPSELFNIIKSIEYVSFCALSTRGKGYWGLVKIKDAKSMHLHFPELVKVFSKLGIKLDESKGKNPTDARFFSIDENAYINPNAKIFSSMVKFTSKTVMRYATVNSSGTLAQKITTRIIKISLSQHSINGSKSGYHNGRLKAGYIAGGYIAGGVIDEREITTLLIDSYESNFFDDEHSVKQKEIKALTESIEAGKRNPIYIKMI